ncbi:uncharacterized protein LOC135102111 [Scylla paramamosain]|uniref:uncharacterized protein LOC135102111 n=1 Tax=Scylla paramamosain TaxID=85552 RepID=UPI003082A9AA
MQSTRAGSSTISSRRDGSVLLSKQKNIHTCPCCTTDELVLVNSGTLRNGVLTALQDKQVLVISGDTGFWKSTQVPQMILDQWVEEGQGGRLQHS